MATLDEERKDFSADKRETLAKSGAAMPDGSYPIENIQDLKNAIQAFGRAKDPGATKAHIIKRARALGATSLLPDSWSSKAASDGGAPKDMLVRAVFDGGVQLRTAADGERDGRLGTLHGHFAVFNRWAKIDSAFEGKFLEQIDRGAFSKAFAESRDGMRVLFQHGKDPQVGDKPLGPITELREDDTGAYYEVPLLDTSYNRDLLPGLQAGLYGASFRFRVLREAMKRNAPASDTNPDALPERTVKEAAVREFGPVTFPAYEGATAGVRSMTDEFILAEMIRDPDRLRRLVDYIPTEPESMIEEDAPPDARRPQRAPASGRREPLYPNNRKRRVPSWLL